MAIESKNVKIVGNKMTCPLCPDSKPKYISRDFYKSKDLRFQMYEGRCYYCKECLEKMCFDSLNIPSLDGFKRVLKDYLNLPFNMQLYRESLEKDKRILGYYITQLNTRSGFKGKDLTWENGEVEEKIDKNENLKLNIDNSIKISQQMIKFWGEFKPEEYLFLQEFYEDLISVYDHSTPIQINIYKNMAKAQLQGNQCLAKGDINGYEKAMKILSSLSTDANIKPVQETGEKEGLSTWGEWVKKIEETEPIPEAIGEFKDVDGIMKYIDRWFVKHFARMLGMVSEPVESDIVDDSDYIQTKDSD